MAETDKVNGHRKKLFPVKPDIGVFIFIAVSVYLILTLISYLTKQHYSFVEVEPGQIINTDSYTGFVVRNEEAVSAMASGSIAYYVSDCSKASKDSPVCVIDPTVDNRSTFEKRVVSSITTDSSSYSDIKEQIRNFNLNYSDSNFSEGKELEYRLGNILSRIVSSSSITDIDKDPRGKYTVMNASDTGIISYTVDGYEGIGISDITADMIKGTAYERKQLMAGDYVETRTPVYKIIYDDTWNIILDPPAEDLEKFEKVDTVDVRIGRDKQVLKASVSEIDNAGHTFICLTMNNYMVKYTSERYLDITVIWESHEGFKIPKSAITTKEYYMVPEDFIVRNDESSETGVFIKNEEGELEFVKVTAYTKLEDDSEDVSFRYIDCKQIEKGTVIMKQDSDEVYTLSAVSKLQGVYNINEGFAEFYMIGKPYEYGDYCVIEKSPGLMLALYDHILLDGSTVHEDQVIY